MVRDQNEQKVIRQIAWMADGGWGPVVIAQKLMAEGIKIRGKDKWHANTVARILKRAKTGHKKLGTRAPGQERVALR